jgi:hypothetical protein
MPLAGSSGPGVPWPPAAQVTQVMAMQQGDAASPATQMIPPQTSARTQSAESTQMLGQQLPGPPLRPAAPQGMASPHVPTSSGRG